MALTSEIDFIILAIHLVVGFVLVYFAMKAFKKTRYPPMAFLAIGLGFIVVGDTLIGDLFEFLGHDIAEIIEESIEITGFIILIFAVKKS
ncbi:MAG TPA: hypothetical protein VMW74_01150 [Nitrosopumilaceae archaeon]|nr:hypothetical protein [Nitrosopumilaceae archaeon]